MFHLVRKRGGRDFTGFDEQACWYFYVRAIRIIAVLNYYFHGLNHDECLWFVLVGEASGM